MKEISNPEIGTIMTHVSFVGGGGANFECVNESEIPELIKDAYNKWNGINEKEAISEEYQKYLNETKV